MKITRYTDYALRVMVFLANAPEGLVAIHALAQACEAPENHIMKVTPALVRGGFVKSTRGRGGGLKLARPAAEIRLGDVVRVAEGKFDLGDCVSCGLTGCCNVKRVLAAAGDAFLATLNDYTLADMLGEDPKAIGRQLDGAFSEMRFPRQESCPSLLSPERAANTAPSGPTPA